MEHKGAYIEFIREIKLIIQLHISHALEVKNYSI